MTPEEIALVEGSMHSVSGSLDELAVRFYARLFAAAPDAQALFTHDPALQRAKFVEELEEIVVVIRDMPAFLERTHELGARHRGYGVRAAHYRTAGDALVGALGDVMGDEMTDEMRDAWRQAFDLVAETMQDGASLTG